MISRNVYNNKLDLYNSGQYDVLDLPGDETFVSSYAYEIHTGEYWAGLSISYDVNPHLAVGLSHMGAYKTTKYYNNYSMTVLPPDTSSSEITRFASTMSFNYWDVKAIFKPSLLVRYPKFRFGLAVTLPSINIMGRGNFYREISTLNMNDVLPFDFAVIDRAKKSKVQHKTVASFGYGLSARLWSKCWLHLHAETFLPQHYYLIHRAKNETEHYPAIINDVLITNIFGNQAFLSYGEAYKSVTNIGVGLDFKLSDRFDMQMGSHTDFNYNKYRVYDFERQRIQATQYDRLVTSVGGNYVLKNGKRIALAFEFGMALPKTTDYMVDFTTPNVARNGLAGDGASGARTYAYSYKLMFELTLGKLLK